MLRLRKDIHVSVNASVYGRLEDLRRSCGFRSIPELARTLLSVFIQYAEAGAERRMAQDADREILGMFDEMGDWEKTPATVVPPARRRRNGNG